MPSAVVLYHYLYPDDVVSAIHITELCTGLVERGWSVTALPSNRGCRDESRAYPRESEIEGVKIHRIWRPRWRQASPAGRVGNLLWMLIAWSLAAFRYRPDVVIVGTDPILSPLVALPWKLVRPKVRIAHWCFDLYPEAAIADGFFRSDSWIVRPIKTLMGAAYRKCDLLVDIGMCMGRRIHQYRPPGACTTLTPWALAEPSTPLPVDASEREAVFGNADLTLLYSGNFGRAHAYERVLSLARLLREQHVAFAFSVRGNAEPLLHAAVTPADTNIRFLPFVSQERLQARLSAADIHIVTLKDEWTGAVVPSKFFGALAAGRPVLFEGSPDCAIAEWIHKFRVGWVLTEGSEEAVAAEIAQLARERTGFQEMFQRCHDTYAQSFSKQIVIDFWDRELRALRP